MIAVLVARYVPVLQHITDQISKFMIFFAQLWKSNDKENEYRYTENGLQATYYQIISVEISTDQMYMHWGCVCSLKSCQKRKWSRF